LRFHAAIWPGILLALGQPLPEKLYVHGFVNINGGKMSKSLGNVISPDEIVKKYSADVFRYYMLRHIPSYDDGDFSWELLEKAYNTELANELGNTVQRTSAMINQYQKGIIGQIPEANHDRAQYWDYLEKCRFDKALEFIWERIKNLNQYIDEQKPWHIAKNDNEEHLQEILAYQVSSLLQIADLLEPFLPETAQKINHIFEDGVIRPIDGTLFPRHRQATD
ncbi:class I tRNA ligase family protein, partial [Candidatus Saccharibacteria bacterium]|nr:class I tRNA ligase family protein [Candidatus Saccharibacteria bacterium]